jgi:hypothetical protein
MIAKGSFCGHKGILLTKSLRTVLRLPVCLGSGGSWQTATSIPSCVSSLSIDPGTQCLARCPNALIHNPYAKNPLVLPSCPSPQSVPKHAKGTMENKRGSKASEFLNLPIPPPPPHD